MLQRFHIGKLTDHNTISFTGAEPIEHDDGWWYPVDEVEQVLSKKDKTINMLVDALIKCSQQLTSLGYSYNHADEALRRFHE
jgi:hypothetical protein